ncbi:MAG: hypothetical protein HY907_09630 [Deltaproteobacteria bacterium]|nr:hypothetical protein [Deltaproteobacteria bacterium]
MAVFPLSRWCALAAATAALSIGCSRTDLETRPWHDYDAGRPSVEEDVPDAEPDLPDVEPEVEPDVEEVPEDVPEDAPEDEADEPEFTGMSCMSAAMCAVCCGTSDFACMLGCVGAADPSASGTLMDIVFCVTGTGCGSDIACIMESCVDEINACDAGPGGTGGCLSLAWCLVSSGCASAGACQDQGLCYQGCFGAARPEAIGAARDLVICMAGTCLLDCAGGLTTTACLGCLAFNCLSSLRGCIGF